MNKVNFSDLNDDLKLKVLLSSLTRSPRCSIANAVWGHQIMTDDEDGFEEWYKETYRQFYKSPLEAVIMYLHHWAIWHKFQEPVAFETLVNKVLRENWVDEYIVGPIETSTEEYERWKKKK